MIRLLATFETDPHKYKYMYQYNVVWHRYEYLDGTIKYNLLKTHCILGKFISLQYIVVKFRTIGIV